MSVAGERNVVVVASAVAAVVAVVLSELALDPADVAYWKRWLGTARYRLRRGALCLVPAALGVLTGAALVSGVAPVADALRGAVAGVTAAALLRANPTRRWTRSETAEEHQIASAMTWLYGRACQRLDAAAGAAIVDYFTRLKVPGPGFPDELLACGEEMANLLNVDRATGSAASRRTAESAVRHIREHMDVLADPLAEAARRNTAAFGLAELLTSQFTRRRWCRRPALEKGRSA